jgi:hypothetical protein
MHWTVSTWRFQLHILLCASVVVIEFVVALNAPNINNIDDAKLSKDYKHFASKYFASENETYTSDKRLIIEEFYRQSALSAKNSHDLTLVNDSSVLDEHKSNETNNDTSRRDKHSVTNEGNEIFNKNGYSNNCNAISLFKHHNNGA